MKILASRLFAALMLTAVLSIGLNTQIFAQQRSALDVYAITNARIVTVSGAPIEKGTIIVRGGLIQSVGANVQIPADARIIDGTGLTVYPGFFDTNTNLGIAARPQAPAGQNPFAAPAATPAPVTSNSNFPVGLQPETSAAELLRLPDAGFETARNNGFTTVLIVPRERIFAGQSALVNTAGETASAAILRSETALHVTFVPLGGGGFPISLLGTFAAVRQMFIDAQRLEQIQKSYTTNQRGVRRPDDDKSLESLFPALRREMPVVFQANTEREIIRALDMAKEFNLRAMIAGGAEAWKVADRLKAQNAAVLISLNFPRRTSAASPEADAESMETLRLRAETPKNAGRLKTVGVKFAFQSGAAANLADFWTNAARAVENGLSKDDALRAMTLGAAELFGVEKQTGSIEAGKIANLTVTRGDVFDKSRTFTHVFVDGKMFEIRAAAVPPAAVTGATTPTTGQTAAGATNVAGSWTINLEIPSRPTTITAAFVQENERLTGNIQSPLGTGEIQSGTITGDQISFKVVVTVGGQTLDINFTGKITGSTMSGTATTPQGTIPFSGTKTP